MFELPMREDHELLKAWCRGERGAGTELFERHGPDVARFFRRKVSSGVRDDLVQETLLACLRSATRFRGGATFRAFLLGIARNVLADHLRQQGRRAARLGAATDIEQAPVAALEPSPVATVVRGEARRLLIEGLSRLPPIHQRALELHYWEGLTAAEIGEVLGVPVGTVKTRLRNGRACLKERLRTLAFESDPVATTTAAAQRARLVIT